MSEQVSDAERVLQRACSMLGLCYKFTEDIGGHCSIMFNAYPDPSLPTPRWVGGQLYSIPDDCMQCRAKMAEWVLVKSGFIVSVLGHWVQSYEQACIEIDMMLETQHE